MKKRRGLKFTENVLARFTCVHGYDRLSSDWFTITALLSGLGAWVADRLRAVCRSIVAKALTGPLTYATVTATCATVALGLEAVIPIPGTQIPPAPLYTALL